MDLSKLIDMRHRYYEKLDELISLKGHNTQFFTTSTYAEMILKVKSSKYKVSHKKPQDYQRLRRFDVIAVGETERLIVPDKGDDMIRSYVHKEEIFQILHDTHLAIGHGGRNRMEKELHRRYKNITREMIIIYLNLCECCENRHNKTKTDFVVVPSMLSSEMKARCQVDLIDMQSREDYQYKFILFYQDYSTKFVQLRPLKSKRAEEVAYVLLDIFTVFGVPSILQSNHGREFSNKVVLELCALWPEVKIVHGNPRPSQSQGFERTKQDIENLLNKWLEENNTQKWSAGLRFVQLTKNRVHHSDINCSPYEAMFGTTFKFGLKSTPLPEDVLADINSEEDLENLFHSHDKIETTERNKT